MAIGFYCCHATSQEKWDLKRLVEYAWANNIDVRLASARAERAAVDKNQAKWAQYPTANLNTNTGLQFGRSIDPTTNQFTTTALLFQGFNLNAGIDVYNWNRIKNNIVASDYQYQAANADVDKAKNDVALNVATYYLQALLARAQMDIARLQMNQTQSQLAATRKKVDAGTLPELNALTLESQYANDSSSYISARSTADQNLLQLKALLALDAALPFELAIPSIEQIPLDPLAELQPELVFQLATQNYPAHRANNLRLKSWEAAIKSARAQLYPTISVGGGLGTNFANPNNKVTGISFLGYSPADPLGPVASVNGTNYPILSPNIAVSQGKKSFGEIWTGWGTQMSNNFQQNIGFNITVPIANGGQARFNLQRTKLDYKSAKITAELDDQKLKNDIYTAYYSATAALEKFNAAKFAVSSSQKAFDFGQKRYDLGLLSTFDLITAQNNLTKARLDMAYAEFDYVFKTKVLEFYKGQGIRLQ